MNRADFLNHFHVIENASIVVKVPNDGTETLIFEDLMPSGDHFNVKGYPISQKYYYKDFGKTWGFRVTDLGWYQ